MSTGVCIDYEEYAYAKESDAYRKGYEYGKMDAVPVVRGWWIFDSCTEGGHMRWRCSACGDIQSSKKSRYCRECGAKMDVIVYFELNNWFAGRDYPAKEPFLSWMKNDLCIVFNNESWVKQNNLCVVAHTVDMAQNFLITAKIEWVINNCNELLTDFKQFLRFPDKYGDTAGRFGHYFLKYSEDNIGIKWEDED